ncbi:MAG: YfiR family protein [Cytophagaceae bacterium]|nr:YfiR family protein [Gemmatimonadaceae bacterium]
MSRRRCISSLTLALVGLLAAGRAGAQQVLDGEAQIKAAFVYNFLKFVEWPPLSPEHDGDSLVVAIVGGGALAEATELFLAEKHVGERRVVVRQVKWDKPLTGVNAVLVTETDAKRVHHILSTTVSGAILSIGEGEAFASTGGVIALVIQDRRVRFDIDIGAASASGLRISSKLLALTRVIHPDKAKGPRP